MSPTRHTKPALFTKSVVVLSLLAGLSGAAFAEDVGSDQRGVTDQRGVSVKERARPDYDAAGIRAGSFMVYPSASLTEAYSDNIYAAKTNKTDDFITTLGAGVAVLSNWNRHSLNLRAGLEQLFYADNADEDNFNWNIGADGRIDILRDTRLSLNGSFAQLHEDRTDPNTPAAASEPTEYYVTSAGASFYQKFNRLFAEVSGTYSKYDYKDVTSLAATVIDQDFRDRDQYTESLKFGYDVSPDTNVYIQGTLNQRMYRQSPPVVALDRDSDGYDIVAGSDFRITNLLQGGVFVGYQKQTYDSAVLSDISGIAYGADVNWFVTPLTTINLSGASSVEETTTAGSSGFQRRSVDLTVDHELMRNVILSGNVGYANESYEVITRKDDVWNAGLGVQYLLNRNFDVGLNYDYSDRSSDISVNDYQVNEVGLTITGKL